MSSDQPPPRPAENPDKRSLRQRIAELLHPAPDSTDALIEVINAAEGNDVIDADVRIMLERVIRMASLTAADVMVAAPRIDMLDANAPFEDNLREVIHTAHSRFPVYQDSRENIIGVLLAKDLLKLQRAPELNVRALLRPPLLLPESKRLYDLLREFRLHRNHMAVLIDEFGRISGLVTIEDVLEEIVGEIEDEFDIPEDEGDIFALADNSWRVSGDTPIERVEDAFEVRLLPEELEDEVETIGGLVAHQLGHVPSRGESLHLGGLNFLVLHARGGAVRWFRVSRLPSDAAEAG
ncbi:CBS domain-containing protein [Corticibacter populi]|uniref:CBS domain-containing protein n=1 Tax=Corticibacter populi TaxID=1550736 RepID=A0A3M6QQD8_9BURK|nr:transporter associated domain-containing protein [Corticibacter populi]RMX04769.1 CBS domain-containing protein [Corticibacter populi]RZS33822.1 magnesium and cobalt transporter [Corticibacter populi]